MTVKDIFDVPPVIFEYTPQGISWNLSMPLNNRSRLIRCISSVMGSFNFIKKWVSFKYAHRKIHSWTSTVSLFDVLAKFLFNMLM